MSVRIPSDLEILREAHDILIEHLAPDKLARLWSILQLGSGDYLAWREETFGEATVAQLAEEIEAFQQARASSRE